MKIQFESPGTTSALLRLLGSLTVSSVDAFRSECEDWLDSHPKAEVIVLDLGQVDLLDSSGLGALLSLLKTVNGSGGDLRLCSISKKVRMVFEITRAYDTFEIFDTPEEALAAAATA